MNVKWRVIAAGSEKGWVKDGWRRRHAPRQRRRVAALHALIIPEIPVSA